MMILISLKGEIYKFRMKVNIDFIRKSILICWFWWEYIRSIIMEVN